MFFDVQVFSLALTSCCCKVKDACHHLVAQVMAWSFQCATSGIGPSKGCFGEVLSGQRAKLANCELAGGWKAAYFGSKYDAKARKETNRFPRSYQHSWVCEACCAQRKHKGWNSCMTYQNFYPQAIHRMTPISTWMRNLDYKFYVFCFSLPEQIKNFQTQIKPSGRHSKN